MIHLPAGTEPDPDGKRLGIMYEELEAIREKERRAKNVVIFLIGCLFFTLGLFACIVAGLTYNHWKHILP